jgi:hypothetical protein
MTLEEEFQLLLKASFLIELPEDQVAVCRNMFMAGAVNGYHAGFTRDGNIYTELIEYNKQLQVNLSKRNKHKRG